MFKHNYLGIFLAGICHLHGASAHTVPLFVSVDATTFWIKPGKTEQVNLFDGLGNTYVPDKHWQNKSTVLFGAGATTYAKHDVVFNTGVRYVSMPDVFLNGSIWQLNNPSFNNLAYRYQVKSDFVLAENAISYAQSMIQPSFIVGIGYAANSTRNYETRARYSHSAPALQLFTDKRVAQLAYEVGGGLDFLYLKPAVIEIAYRLMAAGKGELGARAAQNTTDYLSTGNLYYHTISFGIRLYYDHTY